MVTLKTFIQRGKIIESSHETKCLVKNHDYRILFSTGNSEDLVFPRSSIKIFQAIPFIKSQAVLNYKLNYKTIALACSSHRGEDYHIKELEKWIKKISINGDLFNIPVQHLVTLSKENFIGYKNN